MKFFLEKYSQVGLEKFEDFLFNQRAQVYYFESIGLRDFFDDIASRNFDEYEPKVLEENHPLLQVKSPFFPHF